MGLTFVRGPDHKLDDPKKRRRHHRLDTAAHLDFGKPRTNGYWHPERYFRMDCEDDPLDGRAEQVVGVPDDISVALLGEEPLPMRGVLGVECVARDHRVEERAAAARPSAAAAGPAAAPPLAAIRTFPKPAPPRTLRASRWRSWRPWTPPAWTLRRPGTRRTAPRVRRSSSTLGSPVRSTAHPARRADRGRPRSPAAGRRGACRESISPPRSCECAVEQSR